MRISLGRSSMTRTSIQILLHSSLSAGSRHLANSTQMPRSLSRSSVMDAGFVLVDISPWVGACYSISRITDAHTSNRLHVAVIDLHTRRILHHTSARQGREGDHTRPGIHHGTAQVCSAQIIGLFTHKADDHAATHRPSPHRSIRAHRHMSSSSATCEADAAN